MIPMVVNRQSGNAVQLREIAEAAHAFDVSEVEPGEVSNAVQQALHLGPKRIAVGGGDGTICAGATVLAGTQTELAILPGGTLNHFARDHGIPTDLHEATHVAAQGRVDSADVAYAGDRLFLNTTSVGAYVSYVRLRDRLERYMGYRVASFIAAFRLLFRIRPVLVQLEVDGVVQQYKTPLIFIGVGERELKAPLFGGRIPNGRRCLHVIVVRERRAARLVALGLAAATRGVAMVAQTQNVDSYLVDRCLIGLGSTQRRVALDGEIVTLSTPIEYRIARDILKIVVPNRES